MLLAPLGSQKNIKNHPFGPQGHPRDPKDPILQFWGQFWDHFWPHLEPRGLPKIDKKANVGAKCDDFPTFLTICLLSPFFLTFFVDFGSIFGRPDPYETMRLSML